MRMSVEGKEIPAKEMLCVLTLWAATGVIVFQAISSPVVETGVLVRVCSLYLEHVIP